MKRETAVEKKTRLALEAQQQQSTTESADSLIEDMVLTASNDAINLAFLHKAESIEKKNRLIVLKANNGVYPHIVRELNESTNEDIYHITLFVADNNGESVKLYLGSIDKENRPIKRLGFSNHFSVKTTIEIDKLDADSVIIGKKFLNLLNNKQITFGVDTPTQCILATNALSDMLYMLKRADKEKSDDSKLDQRVKAYMMRSQIRRNASKIKRENATRWIPKA